MHRKNKILQINKGERAKDPELCFMEITIELLQQMAAAHDGKCLSERYLGYTNKLEWCCQKGHCWETSPQNIRQGKWCPFCAGKSRTIKDLQNIGGDKGFALLSTTFKRMQDKYLWKCKNGHSWEASGTHILRGTGCPYCNIFISEGKCRFVFESLLGRKFPKDRKVLGGLELDGFCPELMLAFEFQGIQHFSTKCFARDPQKLRQQEANDRRKTYLCAKLGIRKIDVPWQEATTPIRLVAYIKRALTDIGIESTADVNWDNFSECRTFLEEIKIISEQKGFKCMDDIYWHSQHKMQFQCQCGWVWSATPAKIRRGTGCPRCNKNPRYKLEDLVEIGQKRGLILQDNVYFGIKHKYTWECANGHIWNARGDVVAKAEKCRFCC